MKTYSIIGQSKVVDEKDNIWGFVAQTKDGEQVLLTDDYFSSSIVIALDEIARFNGGKDLPEGTRVKITIDIEE